MDSIELIKVLSEGYSKQSKTANQFWLVLIIASIITMTGSVNDDNMIELPFTLGTVVPKDFYSISMVLISVVSIAYTSAMIQAIRTRMLIQTAIEELMKSQTFFSNIHIQDIVDSILSPTYNRVAPISQFILGKNQFLGQGPQKNHVRWAGIVLYVFFKLCGFISMYLIPLLAVVKCYDYLIEHGTENTINLPFAVIIFLVILALISIVILLVGEIRYLGRVILKIIKS